jgi:hypothetical protein
MIALIPTLVLLLGAAALLALRRLRPAFAYHWLVAVLTALAAWVGVLVSRAWLPRGLVWMTWEAGLPAPLALRLQFDPTSWGYALALATLLLTTLLTSAARSSQTSQPRPPATVLASGLALTALCLLAAAAGDLVTLQLAWAGALLLEWLAWLPQVSSPAEARQFGVEAGLRLLSLLLLLGGSLSALLDPANPDGFGVPPAAAGLLIAAAGLRLGALPPHSPPTRRIAVPPALDPLLRLAPCAPALLLLSRLAEAQQSQPAGLLLALILLASWRAGWILIAGRDEPLSRLEWIPAAGSLALAAAFYAQPEAAFAWGLTLLFLGGTFLQDALRPRWLRPLFWLAALSLASLAFTPTWAGAALYDNPGIAPLLLLGGQGLLVAGWLIQTSAARAGAGPERWLSALYAAGLALGPLMLFGVTFSAFGAFPAGWLARVSLGNLLPGALAAGLTLLILGLRSLIPRRFGSTAGGLRALLGFEWLYQRLPALGKPLQSGLQFFNRILEGQAGMIWAFLLLVLFLTLISQSWAGELP